MDLLEPIASWLYRARRRLASAGVGLLACLLAYHVVFGENGMVAWEHKRAEYRALQKNIDDLQRQNQQLSERIKALKSDPETIEQEAREQLKYARPGEVIYVLPPGATQARPAAPVPKAPSATTARKP